MMQLILSLYNKSKQSRRLTGYIALFLGIFSLSVAPILVKLADAPGIVTSFYRMAITTTIFTPFFLLSEKKNAARPTQEKIAWRYLVFPILAGVCSGMDHSLWSVALEMTGVSNAAVLNSVAPVWISLIALFILREKFNGRFWFGLVFVMLGIWAMAGGNLDIFQRGFSKGDLIALSSSFFYAGYFIFTQVGRRYYSVFRQMWLSLIFCSLTIGVLIFIRQYSLVGYSGATFAYFFIIAFICQLGGYFFVTYALGNLPASIVSPTLGMQSILSSIIAIPILHEYFHLNQFLSCVAILIGIFLINQSKLQEKNPN